MLNSPKRHRESLHAHATLGAEIVLAAIDCTGSEVKKLARRSAQFSESEQLLLPSGECGLIHHQHHYLHDPTLEGWVRECLRQVNFRN